MTDRAVTKEEMLAYIGHSDLAYVCGISAKRGLDCREAIRDLIEKYGPGPETRDGGLITRSKDQPLTIEATKPSPGPSFTVEKYGPGKHDAVDGLPSPGPSFTIEKYGPGKHDAVDRPPAQSEGDGLPSPGPSITTEPTKAEVEVALDEVREAFDNWASEMPGRREAEIIGTRDTILAVLRRATEKRVSQRKEKG